MTRSWKEDFRRVREICAVAYERALANWRWALPVSIAYGITLLVADPISLLRGTVTDTEIGFVLVALLLGSVWQLGYLRLFLSSPEKRSRWELLSMGPYLLKLFLVSGGTTLAAVILILALAKIWAPLAVLGILTALWMGLRLSFFGPIFVTEPAKGIWAAMFRSWRLTRGRLPLVASVFVIGEVAGFLAMLPLGIGLIWTLPFQASLNLLALEELAR